MTESAVEYEVRDGVAVVALNEPQRMNPLSETIQSGLLDALSRIHEDRSVRAMLLTGNGRGFCVGADLKDFSHRADHPAGQESLGSYVGKMMEEKASPIVRGLRTLPVPVICAVNGAAAGGGFGLALAADVVIAARSAYFYLPFVPALGVIPDMGAMWVAVRTIGRARAAALALTGNRLSAEQAEQWGLIWSSVNDDQLMPEAMNLAQQLAALPAHAIGEMRDLLDAAETNSIDEQLSLESARQRELIDGESFREGLNAFRERRKAVFRGR
jgi:2-(1,2-epoxy-1,2-dihydrophenyl)acetyl-CoA isomerase